eukprot:4823108-Pyramimonas_sp.AAC.1
MLTEERRLEKELYESPGGNLVDGLPPVPRTAFGWKSKTRNFSICLALALEASFFFSEERCAIKELNEMPGGDLVDGLPPVPSTS